MDHETLVVGSTSEIPLGAKRTIRLQLLETCGRRTYCERWGWGRNLLHDRTNREEIVSGRLGEEHSRR